MSRSTSSCVRDMKLVNFSYHVNSRTCQNKSISLLNTGPVGSNAGNLFEQNADLFEVAEVSRRELPQVQVNGERRNKEQEDNEESRNEEQEDNEERRNEEQEDNEERRNEEQEDNEERINEEEDNEQIFYTKCYSC
ncbi:hypothetical protein GE061_000209 [Apolygus lucorum]|uniref:Uncharacterized protein n=1 Tax=Apolygus lucorum TaxID=248454 RepID=A0A8S9Y4Y1_APOLU|nr:hypothetical protein GE061_000209 [Apolygus lucorum]